MDYALTILSLAIGIGIGFLMARLSFKAKLSSSETRAVTFASEVGNLRKEIESLREKIEDKNREITEITSSREVLNERADKLILQLDEQKEESARQLEELRKTTAEQLQQQLALLEAKFAETSETILHKRSEQLSKANTDQLSAIIDPLKTSIRDMKEQAVQQEKEQIERISRLDEMIKQSANASEKVWQQAERLSTALTSENKTQGNFGEMQLRTIFEHLGMEEGIQFEEQTTMRDKTGETIKSADGKRLQPDFIVHFPDHRDVIIDSKVSLTAFVDYHNATTDKERSDALKRHVSSVKNHYNELAKKNYTAHSHNGNNSFDMVIMFMFNESALQLALSDDPNLWQNAYDQGVIISGPQSIYMFLRLVQQTWVTNRQLNNQKEIISTAETLISRVQLLYERFGKVKELFNSTEKAFKDVDNSLREGGKSITTSAQQLVKLGVRQDANHKAIPDNKFLPLAGEVDASISEQTEG